MFNTGTIYSNFTPLVKSPVIGYRISGDDVLLILRKLTKNVKLIWLNPVPEDHWDYSSSIELSRTLIDDQMYPLTLKGLEDGMSFLTK